MPSWKRLKSVCQSLAHHSVSGLSYLQPYIFQVCHAAQRDHIDIDLLDLQTSVEWCEEVPPLLLSLKALQQTMVSILKTEGFKLQDLTLVTLRLQPVNASQLKCRARFVATTGRQIVSEVES